MSIPKIRVIGKGVESGRSRTDYRTSQRVNAKISR